MKLSEAEVGSTVVVRHVADAEDRTHSRLQHVGFMAGTAVKVERRAPLGDPTIYELRGYRIALRREAAARIEVDARPAPSP